MKNLSIQNNQTMSSLEIAELTGKDGYGHVYVIGFYGGKIKVGMSFDVETRIKTHRASLGKIDKIIKEWVSPKHFNYKSNERILINALGAYGEIGYGDLDKIISVAESLAFDIEDIDVYLNRITEEEERSHKAMESMFIKFDGVISKDEIKAQIDDHNKSCSLLDKEYERAKDILLMLSDCNTYKSIEESNRACEIIRKLGNQMITEVGEILDSDIAA